jgi:hypothetical protein
VSANCLKSGQFRPDIVGSMKYDHKVGYYPPRQNASMGSH